MGWLVVVARAVSRKTPIYFIDLINNTAYSFPGKVREGIQTQVARAATTGNLSQYKIITVNTYCLLGVTFINIEILLQIQK